MLQATLSHLLVGAALMADDLSNSVGSSSGATGSIGPSTLASAASSYGQHCSACGIDGDPESSHSNMDVQRKDVQQDDVQRELQPCLSCKKQYCAIHKPGERCWQCECKRNRELLVERIVDEARDLNMKEDFQKADELLVAAAVSKKGELAARVKVALHVRTLDYEGRKQVNGHWCELLLPGASGSCASCRHPLCATCLPKPHCEFCTTLAAEVLALMNYWNRPSPPDDNGGFVVGPSSSAGPI